MYDPIWVVFHSLRVVLGWRWQSDNLEWVPSVCDPLRRAVCNPVRVAASLLGVCVLCRKRRGLRAAAFALESSCAKGFEGGAVDGRTPHSTVGCSKWARIDEDIFNDVLSSTKFNLDKRLRKERTSCLCFRRAYWLPSWSSWLLGIPLRCHLPRLPCHLPCLLPWSGHLGSPMGSRVGSL